MTSRVQRASLFFAKSVSKQVEFTGRSFGRSNRVNIQSNCKKLKLTTHAFSMYVIINIINFDFNDKFVHECKLHKK